MYTKGKKDKLFACNTGMRSAQSGDCVLPLAGARRYEVKNFENYEHILESGID